MKSGARVQKVTRMELKERLYRRRYLVPNAVTLGNLFCGFLTIIYASTGRFEKATIAIAIALLLDGLDGRVARRLNATSKFGIEFDSFADLVSFGVGPALLIYYWCFQLVADEFGVMVCFIYALCAASRLARFNISEENLKSFQGLPTPGAAGMVAALVNFLPRIEQGVVFSIMGTMLLISLAFLMVSNIEFPSIKQLKVRGARLSVTLLLGSAIALIWYNSQFGFLFAATGYCMSGPAAIIYKRRKKQGSLEVLSEKKRAS